MLSGVSLFLFSTFSLVLSGKTLHLSVDVYPHTEKIERYAEFEDSSATIILERKKDQRTFELTELRTTFIDLTPQQIDEFRSALAQFDSIFTVQPVTSPFNGLSDFKYFGIYVIGRKSDSDTLELLQFAFVQDGSTLSEFYPYD